MFAQLVFVLTQVLLIQSALSQCLSPAALAPGLAGPYGVAGASLPFNGRAAPGLCAPGFAGLAAPGLAATGLVTGGTPAIEFTSTNGGGLTVTSASAIPPTGITVVSENAFEGILSVVGEVPFVGSSGMEGVVPSAGTGVVNHGCGNGVNAITSDGIAPIGLAAGAIAPAAGMAPAAFAPVAAINPTIATFPNAPYSGCGRGLIL